MSAPLAPHLLSRSARHRAQSPDAGQPLVGDLRLARARAHEFCGPARRTLALMLAGRMDGPVIWIGPSWMPDRLNADGVRPFLSPARLIFVTTRRAEDLLWSVEETLRAAVVPLVIADLPAPPGLTPVRRLHLAAENAAATGGLPIAVLLTPGSGGAQGVETRWEMAPAHAGADTGALRWQLWRRRARSAATARWDLRAGPDGRPEIAD